MARERKGAASQQPAQRMQLGLLTTRRPADGSCLGLCGLFRGGVSEAGCVGVCACA